MCWQMHQIPMILRVGYFCNQRKLLGGLGWYLGTPDTPMFRPKINGSKMQSQNHQVPISASEPAWKVRCVSLVSCEKNRGEFHPRYERCPTPPMVQCSLGGFNGQAEKEGPLTEAPKRGTIELTEKLNKKLFLLKMDIITEWSSCRNHWGASGHLWHDWWLITCLDKFSKH